MSNNPYYKQFCEEHLGMFKQLVSPMVFSVNVRDFISKHDCTSTSELISIHCFPLYYSIIGARRVVPSLFVCDELSFLAVKIKYGEFIHYSWTEKEFRKELKLIYRNKKLNEKAMKIFNPLQSFAMFM